ncbi:zinc-ribbon domain-containing protein [Pseudodonghicola sp.]|uniref:zinc-ribbon domain-containing protein n=1 Tax=Pseudodonghicola sp. TaxID=1969463 RepID=UPI003A97E24E
MRLTCPNCGAQYEVPDEVIPLDGRDVQCSACSHTWFQDHPANPAPPIDEAEQDDWAAETSAEEELRTAITDEEEWLGFEAAEDHEPTPPEPTAPEAEPEPDLPPDEEAEEEPAAEPPAAPARSALDTSISDILRQEAEREVRLRAKEAVGLESQPDLGLDSYDYEDEDLGPRQAADSTLRARRSSYDKFEDEDEDNAPAPSPAVSRRDLLPDIEEINSTLRAGGAATRAAMADNAMEAEDRPRSGFMRGFAVALILGAFLLIVYANAPRIARAVPQADPALSAYVAMIDQARYWIDAKLGGQGAE